MRLGVISLGCPKNTVDTEVMLSYLKDFHLTNNPEKADYVIINTCGFLQASRDEADGAIGEMLSLNGPKVIAAGCFVTKDIANLRKKYHGVHAWLGVNDIANIRRAVDIGGVYTSSKPCIYSSGEHTALLNGVSAYVKISEGCGHRCSFCTIPSIKGKYRSRKIQDIVSEINNLVDSGVKEINLISQDLAYYGRDNYKKPVLPELLKKICASTRKYFWIRLLYLYPDAAVIDGVIGEMKKDERICRYLDIPFQHVSDKILSSMRRGHGIDRITGIIRDARRSIDGLCLRSSFITGYPGETAADFLALKKFIAAGYVDKAGIFAYSDEPGTHAFTLEKKVKEKTALERQKILALASAEVCYYNNSREKGKMKKALVIGRRANGIYIARTQENAPDIDGYVVIKSKKSLKTGKFYDCKITKYSKFDLEGAV
jgi:ribosomal protein S12 methylthiotransferase